MGLRNLHTFDAEYASAYGILKALYAFAKRKNKIAKSDPTFNYVAQFACREGAWLAAAKDLVARILLASTLAIHLKILCVSIHLSSKTWI